MAVIDVPGFIADLKDHAVDHQFHVHDERHFVETYSLRQAWEVDLHPEDACGGPLDLHLALEVDPRTLLTFEDRMLEMPEGADPPEGFAFPLAFTWVLPPLPKGPDLLVLATELAGVGGTDLPLEVSAIDSFASVTDAPERSLTIVSRVEVGLDRIFLGQEGLCDILDRCHEVSGYLLDRAPTWLDELQVPSTREVIEFTGDDLDLVLSLMDHIGEKRDGWINIRPAPPEDDRDQGDGRLTEFSPTPPAAPVGLFARRKPLVIEATWVPGGPNRRGGVDPATIGLEHTAGRFAVRQLRDAGHPVPAEWKVVSDNARRGLVLSIPEGTGAAPAQHEEILRWLLGAATALAPMPLTGVWQAEIRHRQSKRRA